MLKIKYLIVFAASSLLLWDGNALASSITTSYSDGTTWDITRVVAYDTTGNTMDGLSVTINWSDSTVTTAHWADNAGAVNPGTDYAWSLTYSNDFIPSLGYDTSTYSAHSVWTLSNNSTTDKTIASMVINGESANIVFDTIYPAYVTPNSAEGWSVSSMDNSSLSITAEYSNIVSVNGTTYSITGYDHNHDLYTTLSLDFSGGLSSGNSTSFQADTDNVNYDPTVPEPGTMLLFGLGLAGVAGLRTRKKVKLGK